MLAGEKFGRWTVLHKTDDGLFCVCQCSCGTERPVRTQSLRRGLSTNCGCVRKEKAAARFRTHGRHDSPTYANWTAMKSRCSNPNGSHYERYGGRGVFVCERWERFENFLADMGERPEGTTIDRIDNNMGYEPGNCRWATRQEQVRNRSITLSLTFLGKTQSLSAWAEEVGISYSCLLYRYTDGWPVERILTTPSKRAKHA